IRVSDPAECDRLQETLAPGSHQVAEKRSAMSPGSTSTHRNCRGRKPLPDKPNPAAHSKSSRSHRALRVARGAADRALPHRGCRRERALTRDGGEKILNGRLDWV